MTLDDPKGLVGSGYDRISEAYRADSFSLTGTWYETALDALEEVVPEGSRILDLGCGCGVPIAAELSRRHRVTGVDLSARQVERARAIVPGAAFVRADMTSVAFRSGSFDAIVSLFAIIHVPTGEQASVFDAIVGWLRPGGILLVTVGAGAWTGTEDDWYGAPMYWSHGDRDSYHALLRERGFTTLREWVIPEDESSHAAFLARSDGVRDRR